jgi:X-X-X-Leu-X-X-Gly heptad repeat protein
VKMRHILAAATMVAAQSAAAQTANQTVTIQVDAINVIAFAGSPSLVINTAVAGSAPSAATNATATWAVTTNQSGSKITASIGSAMPAGLTLSVSLAAPTGGSSNGLTALSTSAADLVTGITKLAEGTLGVTYQLDATVAAGVVASTSRTVTYTITGGV